MISCGCSPRKSREAGPRPRFWKASHSPRGTSSAERALRWWLRRYWRRGLHSLPLRLLRFSLLLLSRSEPPQLFVRPPGSTRVADHECWDLAVLLFTMARTPVADHKVAPP